MSKFIPSDPNTIRILSDSGIRQTSIIPTSPSPFGGAPFNKDPFTGDPFKIDAPDIAFEEPYPMWGGGTPAAPASYPIVYKEGVSSEEIPIGWLQTIERPLANGHRLRIMQFVDEIYKIEIIDLANRVVEDLEVDTLVDLELALRVIRKKYNPELNSLGTIVDAAFGEE